MWLAIIWVILRWITIISKFNGINNILEIFDRLISKTDEPADETSKKMEFSFKYVN